MNKEDLTQMVAEILQGMGKEPMVKGSDYKPANPGPEARNHGFEDGDFVRDISQLDLRKLYLTEGGADPERFRKLKEKTPARSCRKMKKLLETLNFQRFRSASFLSLHAILCDLNRYHTEKP